MITPVGDHRESILMPEPTEDPLEMIHDALVRVRIIRSMAAG
jgi:hypothetical protein